MNSSNARLPAEKHSKSMKLPKNFSQLRHEIKEERAEELLFGGRPDIYTEALGLPVLPSLKDQKKLFGANRRVGMRH